MGKVNRCDICGKVFEYEDFDVEWENDCNRDSVEWRSVRWEVPVVLYRVCNIGPIRDGCGCYECFKEAFEADLD